MNTTIDQLGVACVELDANESHLHDWGGKMVCSVIVKQADGKESRFWLRVRIPDDPRGGVEGDCYAVLTGRGRGDNDVVREVRSPWKDYESQ